MKNKDFICFFVKSFVQTLRKSFIDTFFGGGRMFCGYSILLASSAASVSS